VHILDKRRVCQLQITITKGRNTIGELMHQLRWALPMWFVLKVTDWLPENRVTLQLRGVLARPFIADCGRNLQVGVGVSLLNTYNLHLGNHVYIAKGVWLNAMGELYIEDEVVLGPYVVISTLKHSFKNGSVRFGGSTAAPVRIGEGTWVAAHASIKCGVKVGQGCVIAANAAVTSDVPRGSVAGGVPARVIGPNIESDSAFLSRKEFLKNE
jgi:acetyltransferase-like isoleucine patch superfamily enzyme